MTTTNKPQGPVKPQTAGTTANKPGQPQNKPAQPQQPAKPGQGQQAK